MNLKSWTPFQKAILVSVVGHFSIFLVAEITQFIQSRPSATEITLIENPLENPKPALSPVRPLDVKPKIEKPKPDPKKAVFGLSRKSIPDDSGITAKAGNTIAKAQDDKKLKAGDPDSLPLPEDEFLISEMPRMIGEVRIPYPPEAKKNNVQGVVVMDLLIDTAGRVRKVDVVEGPGFGLNEAAATAITQFQFSPAKVGDKLVAVRIRYAYRFVLEK